MAGWLTLIKALPWGDVIAAAPHVVGAAKRLMGNARRVPESAAIVGATREGDWPERVAALEVEASALREQMLASSRLIEQLAEQNEQLVARAEVHRRKLKMLTVVVVLMAVVLGGMVVWLAGRM